jgi:DNA-binding transcriptional LysR family regulator
MRPTSIDELRMIVAVEAHGSLSAAAEALGVSQQAVSQRMRVIERRWALPLFERTARGTALTAQGALVAEWAGGLVAQVDAFDYAVLALRTDREAHVRIAASLTIAEHLVPGWLVTYGAEEGAAMVELSAVNSATVIDRVRAGTDALGFVETPNVPRDLTVRVIGHDEIGIVVAPGHPWARRSVVSAAEVAATRLVGREPGSGTRLTLERALGAVVGADAVAEPAAELASTAGIRATVMAGSGVGALSLRAVRDDLAAGRLVRVPVDIPPMSRPLAAVSRRDRPLSAAAARLLEIASSARHTL